MKKEILTEMLRDNIIFIRSIQACGFWSKVHDKACYYEIELIYRIPSCLLDDNFTKNDINFLNLQARYYYENCSEHLSVRYQKNIHFISKLFLLMPAQQKILLEWEGPECRI